VARRCARPRSCTASAPSPPRLEEPLDEVVQPGALVALCAIDSCLKRYRRVKVVQALKGLPVDIYGENWQQHVGARRRFAC
jgi:hypothetical protein